MATDGELNDAPTASLEGSKAAPGTAPKRSPKKIYVPIRIQTNALNNDDIAINATYISIEDLTRSRRERKNGRNIEIRYLESFRSLKDKIKSSYSCNQEHCPMIKERLDQHLQSHHSNPVPAASRCSHHHDRQSQTKLVSPVAPHISKGTIHRLVRTEPGFKRSVLVSPTSSILKRIPTSTESHSMQTPAKFVDFSHATQSSFEANQIRTDEQTQFSPDNLPKPIRVENQTTVTPKSSFARDELNEEIQKWFEDIPIYPNLPIYDNFLNALPMWYPGAKRDQDLLKNGIKNNLLKKIKSIREKGSNQTPEPTFVDDTVNTDEVIINSRSISQLKSEDKEKLIESEVLEWLMHIKFKETDEIGRTVNIIDATDIFTKRLMPILDKPCGMKNYKLILKGLIVDTLNDLPNVLHYPKNKRSYLNRIAEDLANRLLLIQSKYMSSFNCCKSPRERSMYRLTISSKSSLRQSLMDGINNCLKDFNTDQRHEIKEEITDIIIDCIESIQNKENIDDKVNANDVLENSLQTFELQASEITLENVRDILTEDIMKNSECNINLARPCHSATISVFTSEQEISTAPAIYPVTSTPKKKPTEKEVSKLSAEEVDYMNKLSCLIRAWMELLPRKFNAPEEKEFKDTMVKDLAGDITDQAKLEQLAPQTVSNKHYRLFVVYKWLLKFDIYEDLNEGTPLAEDLIKRIEEIPVPDLTKSQRGTRQAMSNIKHMESDLGWKEHFVPKGIDILEDEISIFMSELPPEAYQTTDKDKQNKMVHELADAVKKCLENKKPDSEINDELSKWLKKMVKPNKHNIKKLTEELKKRIKKLPQDATITANIDKKKQRIAESAVAKDKCPECSAPNTSNNEAPVAQDTDRTLMEFIGKYMERNYDVDDTLTKGAFVEILKTEFRKLTPPTRKEVYDNFSKSKQHDEFSPERLGKELQYIKIISDWLRNIPIDGSFNTPNNKKRIEFVNDLAKNVYEVEESRRQSPTAMDYDMYLASIISQSINELPVLPEQEGNLMLMIDELIGMIIANRTPMPCCADANQTAASINSTGIQEQNISDFIDNYIRLNAGEVAHDQVKLDAWSARLLKEVKKLVKDTADPSTLCKSQVYNKLINVPIPEEESIRLFGLELDYAKEISEWLNNLPLLPITSEEASAERVKMISDLAEKFADRERNKIANPEQTPTDSEIEDFITKWIQQLPLDKNREVIYPIVIQQLLKRIDRANKGPEEPVLPQTTTNESNTSKKNKSKAKSKPKSPKSCKPSCCPPGGKTGRSGQVIIDAIENWSNKLPIRAENKDAEKIIKDDVARKLYQKVGELSVDPQIMNDDPLYQELLADEVNAQLSNLQGPEIQKKKESLKNDLIDKVMEGKSLVQECIAGDIYKQKLENTIEASIPNPVHIRQYHDPGFEIYKNRLADMFILENFDHGNDDVKVKYEKLIKKEIDKYFKDALKRNALPLTKEQIYSELYSALYKVPTPSEFSTAEEVEEVKTRCEIDDWFANLPVEEASGPEELLERNKILSMLAKRLHEIEKNEQKPDDKMHKEITKWVVKFPLQPGQDIDKSADDLQNRLKCSKDNRKCTPASSLNGKESKKNKVQMKGSKSKGILGTSQIAGPSSTGQKYVSPPASPVCCQGSGTPRKKPADIILEVVQLWCESIPLYASTPQDQENNRVLREDLLTKIIMKICELNSSPQTFSDDLLYNYLLDQELDKLISQMPICCDFKPSKDLKKMQLVGAIASVKTLIREERERHEYVDELKNTVNSVLEPPLNTTADKIALFDELRDDIVDNFVQYHFNRDDEDGKQIYKAKLRDAVTKYFLDVNEKQEDPPVDPLIRQNQLICELTKIPIPSERAIKDEVEDIRMKNEVKQFFEELAFLEDDEEKMKLINDMKLSLAKQLNEIEKTGHNCTNDAKMKKEISRCLKKLDKQVDPEKIQAFIDRLKNNEGGRKALPAGKTDTCYCPNETNQAQSEPGPCQCSGHPANQATIPQMPQIDPANLRIPEIRRQGTSLQSQGSLGVTPIEYQGFGGGVVFSSSRQGVGQNRSLPVGTAPIPPPRINRTAPNLEEPLEEGEFMLPEQGETAPLRAEERQRMRRAAGEKETEEDCKCLRGRRKFRGRPRCVLRRPEYCDLCEDFGPMWMPMPPFRFPPGYFYY